MNSTSSSSNQPAHCATVKRRGEILASRRLAGLDYAEVGDDGKSLVVHFFGCVPEGLSRRNVVIEGGRRIRDIKVLSAKVARSTSGDATLHVKIDKPGDFSTYSLCIVEPAGASVTSPAAPPLVNDRNIPNWIDPRYACLPLRFRFDCHDAVDCKPPACQPEPSLPAPDVNYLARDFQTFRQLMLDRMSVTMPQWRERHIPDIGITLVELLAYAADQLSYSLDAVATEAFLATARRRISIRRHARLVDYRMHEGCNSRAWVTIESDSDQTFSLQELAFAVPPRNAPGLQAGQVSWGALERNPDALIYEPIDFHATGRAEIWSAHSEIHFYTWGESECCLPAGSTSATLLDRPLESMDAERPPDPKSQNDVEGSRGKACDRSIESSPTSSPAARVLKLAPGDVLILEEIRGPRTGALADADPTKRHAVRLTRVTPSVDPVNDYSVLEVEWEIEDALPFTLCISSRTEAPDCRDVETAVARGNVVLVDHGMTVDESDEGWVVGVETLSGCCGCDAALVDIPMVPRPLLIMLGRPQLTHAEVIAPATVKGLSAAALLRQDPRMAVAHIQLDDGMPASPGIQSQMHERTKSDDSNVGPLKPVWRDSWDWTAQRDLLSSSASDRHFVVEMDDDRRAHLRFGDDDCGRQPEPGLAFRASYRVGNSSIANVGYDAITLIAIKRGMISGLQLRPRNPLPAVGGTDPESTSDVKLYAPHAYSRVLERAVSAPDYAELAGRDSRVQSAYAELAWTGSWYEADVALDPLAKTEWDRRLPRDVERQLLRARRIGHDLRIVPARTVPLVIGLDVTVKPHYSRSDVEVAIREALSNKRLANGALGLFHPDRLHFGTDVAASHIVTAVQKIDGVQHVEVAEFRRQDMSPNPPDASDDSFANNFIEIRRWEIARLDNDRDFPENGYLRLTMKGGL